ncbi:hypothetical protein [Streptomyces resistomycificus]|uniref:hypothetical protein n=1 Tax=Streptomyces resistomycificus TaxID=67356 RepID=UPI000AF6CC78|nr:hypothetical protein [Streptomyces resistomycificus]
MALQTITLSVLIASPGDTASERNAVEDVIRSWNSDHTLRRKIHLLPLRWELGAVPMLGSRDAQQEINEQFADAADIVIALFNSRLGKATKRAVSGTAEEILRARERGAAVHVFFSEGSIPRDHDPDQLKALNEFRKELQEHGLTGSYVSVDDLVAKVRRCLEHDAYDLGELSSSEADVSGAVSGAILRSTYLYDREPATDSKGRVKVKSVNERLRVENIGDAAAEDVVLELRSAGEGEAPITFGDLTATRILPRAHVDFPVGMHMGVSMQGTVIHRWSEGGEAHSEEQTISWT